MEPRARATWMPDNQGLPSPQVPSLVASPAFAEDRTLFAGTSSGVARSADGGESWQPVGAALSAVLQKQDRVSVAFFGDGAADEGTFAESLNYASLKGLPVETSKKGDSVAASDVTPKK